MADESAVSGMDVLGEILARFRTSGAIARCEAEHPAVGHWSVRLTLVPAHPTVQVAAGGTLAIEPVGSCLGAALNESIAATPVPQSFIGGVRFDTVNLPGP